MKTMIEECKAKLRDYKVLVHPKIKYKSAGEKKLAKLEALYEKTPKECALKRARILKQANRLVEKMGRAK